MGLPVCLVRLIVVYVRSLVSVHGIQRVYLPQWPALDRTDTSTELNLTRRFTGLERKGRKHLVRPKLTSQKRASHQWVDSPIMEKSTRTGSCSRVPPSVSKESFDHEEESYGTLQQETS